MQLLSEENLINDFIFPNEVIKAGYSQWLIIVLDKSLSTL